MCELFAMCSRVPATVTYSLEEFAPHGGETPRQVVDRITRALKRIARAHPRDRVIVVTHGGALSMTLVSIALMLLAAHMLNAEGVATGHAS